MRWRDQLGSMLVAMAAASVSFAQGDLPVGDVPLQYCVPVEKIDWNPFRVIRDGKDLAYLTLLKSYISSDPNEPGILESYEFSPDGTLFTGRMALGLKWPDGTIVTAREAALGVAKTLTFRTLGERIKVTGTEKINAPGWETREFSGVEILDARTFRIRFESKIQNLTGVVREALSTNSRHNRFWPTKINAPEDLKLVPMLGRFAQVRIPEGVGFQVYGRKVIVVDRSKCRSPDFTIFADQITALEAEYESRKSPNASAATLQPNTIRLKLSERAELIEWVRSAFSNSRQVTGNEIVPRFFAIGEPGFDPTHNWGSSTDAPKALKGRQIKIAYEIPIFRTVLEEAAKRDGSIVRFVELPAMESDVDAQILASGIQEGRHLVLQDALTWAHVRSFLGRAPETTKSLEDIARKSASTLPPDNATLRLFESRALAERSLAPIARKYPVAYSKKRSAVCLAWTIKGEVTFWPRERCDKSP